MKAVYIETTTIVITLTNGNKIVKKDYNPLGFVNYIYQYGEVPNNTTTYFTQKDFFYLARLMSLSIRETLFKKRLYIWDYTLGKSDFGRRIYENEVQSFIVKRNYKIITNPSVKKLRSDLDFYTYSQLIFDREQSLKGMLNKGD